MKENLLLSSNTGILSATAYSDVIRITELIGSDE